MARTHLVGSMNLPDAETVFRTVAAQLGDSAERIPDGETGPRQGWIFSMIARLARTPGLVQKGTWDSGYTQVPLFGLAEGVSVDELTFELGLGDATAAWPQFKALKDEGVIPAGAKFQIALPTAMAVAGNFLARDEQAVLFPRYEQCLAAEIAEVAARLPNDEIAIQWDVAVEFGLMEEAFGPTPLPRSVIIDQIVRMSEYVPASIELGYHLCYGDAPSEPGAKGRHFKEPEDTALLVEVANAIADRAARPIAFIHMPVPIARDDDAYFAPLHDLRLRPETTLYLGLMHEEDGVEGAQRRIAAASRHVTGFGVGTECGMGNEPLDRIPELLRYHRDVVVGD